MSATFASLALRARLAARSLGPLTCGALLLVLVMGGALAWLAPQPALQAERQKVALRVARLPATATMPAPQQSNANLAQFYGTLGERRYAEQQVKTLFALAAKADLSLSQGEYKASYDRHSRVHAYQVTLPVKGSYAAVWNFALDSLRAIPFASLDDISFKRDSIGDDKVAARLRLTLYLADQPGVPQ